MVLLAPARKFIYRRFNQPNQYRIKKSQPDILTTEPKETIQDIQASSDAGTISGAGIRRRTKNSRNNDKLRKFISLKI
jgi:hypothetical protein